MYLFTSECHALFLLLLCGFGSVALLVCAFVFAAVWLCVGVADVARLQHIYLPTQDPLVFSFFLLVDGDKTMLVTAKPVKREHSEDKTY